MYNKKTKVVCTLGPSTDSVSELRNLIHAGMNVARLNFSHGTYEHHKKIIDNLRKAEKLTGRRIAILQDLQGPKIRTGTLPEEGIHVKRSDIIILTIENKSAKTISKNKHLIPVQYKDIVKDCKKNDLIMIDDGLIELKALRVSKKEIECKVMSSGIIKSHKGINVPTASISAPPITIKDKKDLEWGLKQNFEYIALSFVKSEKDILALRKLIKKAKKDTKIVAKIERHEAVKNLKEIIKASDAVMVARGDLGIEIAAEQVPIVQKRIIHLSNKHAKPVITATQVLQSMVENPRATRAEISDAANAIFDNTDAIMLSNESAVGAYPFKAAATLSKVAMTVEKEMQKDHELLEFTSGQISKSTMNATCLNACELARDTKASHIIVYTDEGFTARQIARSRTFTPIITITPSEKVARELSLVWGLSEIFVQDFKVKATEKPGEIIKFLKKKKLVKKGEKLVTICNASKREKIISTFKI